MARYDERPLQLTDILGRFEAHPHQIHVHHALGLIGRLEDEGRRFWPEGSEQLQRWERGATDLWGFMNRLGTRRDLESQDLQTAMREFIQEFEHTTGRMYQMLYGETDDPDDDQRVTEIFDWFNIVFRSSIYALLSGWIEDKQEENLVEIQLNLATGESSQEWTRTAMVVPKKYRRATEPI